MNNQDHCYSSTVAPDRRRGEQKKEGSSLENLTPGDNGTNGRYLQRRTPPPFPSPTSSDENDSVPREERVNAARLLKSCGVKFYSQLARDFPPDLIRAKVEEWREEPELGAGMLVKMIQGGGPVVGAVPPIERPTHDGDWLQRRYDNGRGD